MTDNEIIKDMGTCIKYREERECGNCSRIGRYQCAVTLMQDAFNLINRQKVEIEKAWELFEKKSDENIEMQKLCDKQKAEIAELREDDREKFDAIQDLKIFTEKQDAEIERLKSMNQAKLDTIHDLMTEIEKLKNESIGNCEMAIAMRSDHNLDVDCNYCIDKAKSEAYRDFWDRLKKEADFISGGNYGFSFEIREDVAEEIIKELTEENK